MFDPNRAEIADLCRQFRERPRPPQKPRFNDTTAYAQSIGWGRRALTAPV